MPNNQPQITRTSGESRPASIEYLTISSPATASVMPPSQIGRRRPNRSSKAMPGRGVWGRSFARGLRAVVPA